MLVSIAVVITRLFHVFLIVCAHVCGDNVQESFLSFHHTGSKDQTQAPELGNSEHP